MLNDVIEVLMKKNSEYAEYRERFQEYGAKVREIIDELPEDEKKIMNTYESILFNKMSIEQNEFYCRGYKDCIKILKWLGIM